MLSTTIIDNPFNVGQRRNRNIPYRHQRLSTILNKYASEYVDTTVHVNGIEIAEEHRRRYRVANGDLITIQPRIKEPISMSLAIAAAWGLGTTATIALTIGITATMVVGTGLLLRALGPDPAKTDGAKQSQSFSFEPITRQERGMPVQRAYGENKHSGVIIGGWTTPDGESDDLSLILGLGDGPCEGIVADTVKLNDLPISDFNASYEERRGLCTQEALYEYEQIPYQPDRVISHDEGAFIWTTPDDDFDRLSITLQYSGFYYHKSGSQGGHRVDWRIEISESGENDWSTLVDTNVADITIRCANNPQYLTFISDEDYGLYEEEEYVGGGQPVAIENGKKYDIRVTKLSNDYDLDRVKDEVKLNSVREIIDTAFTYPGLSMLKIDAVATEKLNGAVNASCVQQGRIVQVYNGSSWVLEYSNNPAWIIIDLITLPVISGDGSVEDPYTIEYYEGEDISRITPNLANWYVFAQWCDELVDDGDEGTEKRITFNSIFDQDSNIWDCIKEVCQVARCEVVPEGVTYDVIVDKKWTENVVQLFSAGNMIAGTYTEEYLPANKVSEVEVSFLNAAENYDLVPLAYVNPSIATYNKKSIKARGIIKESEAWRYATFELLKNQYCSYVCSFDVSTDALTAKRGDVIGIISPWDNGGRIKSVPSISSIKIEFQPENIGASNKLMIRSYSKSSDADVVNIYTINSISDKTITVDEELNPIPLKDDIWAIAATADASKKWRIIGIKQKNDLTHTIYCIEYFDEIYGGDDGTPVIPMPEYTSPVGSTSPSFSGPISDNDLRRRVPDLSLLSANYNVPIFTNVQWSSDTPSEGYISWSQEDGENDIELSYGDSVYTITPGNTNLKFVYWDSANPNVLGATDTLSSAISGNRWYFGTNTDGEISAVPTGFKAIHGGLIQASTITAAYGQIGALAVETLNIAGSAVTTDKINNWATLTYEESHNDTPYNANNTKWHEINSVEVTVTADYPVEIRGGARFYALNGKSRNCRLFLRLLKGTTVLAETRIQHKFTSDENSIDIPITAADFPTEPETITYKLEARWSSVDHGNDLGWIRDTKIIAYQTKGK